MASGENLTTVLKFADMADDRKEVIANICEPAGLDKGKPEHLVPTIAAWRLASAMGKVEIEARAKGEDPLKEVSMSTDQRIVLDKQSQAYYKFKWPDTMLVANPVMAKLKKMIEKKLRYTPALTEATSILEKGGGQAIMRRTNGSGSWRSPHQE